MTDKQTTALALYSGGLDSTLACRVVMAQSIRVLAVKFVTPFFGYDLLAREHDYIRETKEKFGIDVMLKDISRPYLSMVQNPAHGPCIEDGTAKVREYIAHRRERDAQILEAMAGGADTVAAIVKVVYAAYPEALHAAAGQSVTSHLRKLEHEGRVRRTTDEEPLVARWQTA